MSDLRTALAQLIDAIDSGDVLIKCPNRTLDVRYWRETWVGQTRAALAQSDGDDLLRRAARHLDGTDIGREIAAYTEGSGSGDTVTSGASQPRPAVAPSKDGSAMQGERTALLASTADEDTPAPTVCPTCKDTKEVWDSYSPTRYAPCPDCNKAPQILGVDHSADGYCVVEGLRHTDGTIEVTSVTNTPTEGEKP